MKFELSDTQSCARKHTSMYDITRKQFYKACLFHLKSNAHYFGNRETERVKA